MTPELVASARAPGLFVAPGTVIPDDASIAPHVTIYAGVSLGAGLVIGQGAILGRPQQIDARSRSPRLTEPRATLIGDGCRIGSHTVVVTGVTLAAGAAIADHVLLREGVTIGAEAMIGRGTAIAHDVVVGERTRIQNNCLVGPTTVIAADVLVSPNVTFVGDPTMGRSSPRALRDGIRVLRAARIGTGAILFPSVTIGEEAVVGAAALVRQDVGARTVVVGSPARLLRAVREDEFIAAWAPD